MGGRTAIGGRGSWIGAVEPSRAWILGLTVGRDGRVEVPAELGEGPRGLGAAEPACECPDDCLRDHPNE
jgi:hypothetical protein